MRDTPPDVQSGPLGYEPDGIDNFSDGYSSNELTPEEAENIARLAYEASTDWLDTARRSKWGDSLRAFNSQHPSGSKYLSREYQGRSTLYRPVTRMMVRKAESATATAFFSNEDVVSIDAENDDDPIQQASSEILSALIQYRLTKTIPWFQTLVGARQDAEVMGICLAKVYWKYKERNNGTDQRPKLHPLHGMPSFDPETGEPEMEDFDRIEIIEDRPAIDLISPENFRFDPGADWRDPIGTSPYLIELIPMFHQDVMEKIDSGEWLETASSAVLRASNSDTTRNAREQNRTPGRDSDQPTPFTTVWIRSNIIRHGGEDFHFYTLDNSGELLTEPRPLSEVFLHGERPYVCGTINLETHKTYPSSKVELTRDLQRIANDDLNLRFDAVKMSLNPRQFVKSGSAVELNDLRTMVPGKVVMVKTDRGEPPNSVIAWDRPPEPTAASYQEQQLNQLDWDSITGQYSNASVQANGFAQQSATGAHLLSGEASSIQEYELRIFAETFVQPVIELLIKMEQAYETDETILAIAAAKAQLFQRFGHDKVTDDLLNGAVTTRINVGLGATNGAMKMRALAQAAQTLESLMGNPIAAQGLEFHEILKEIFANAGYRDGERFIKPGFDPAQAMQAMQQAKAGGKGGGEDGQVRLQAAQIAAQGRIQEAQIHAQIEAQKLQQESEKAQLQQQSENWRTKYQQDHEAWSAGVPQQAQAVTDTLNSLLPAIQAMHETAVAGQHHMAAHGAALNQLTQSTQQLHQAHNQLAQQQAAQHAQTHRHMANIATHLTAPRRIVRDENGKVAGVETVPPNPQSLF